MSNTKQSSLSSARSHVINCASCGFLSIRAEDSDEVDEITAEMRRRHVYWNSPFCFPFCLRGVDIKGEAAKIDQSQAGMKVAIEVARNCPFHTKYLEGFSPKEHLQLEQIRIVEQKAETRIRYDRYWRLAEIVLLFILGAIVIPYINFRLFPDRSPSTSVLPDSSPALLLPPSSPTSTSPASFSDISSSAGLSSSP